MCRLAVKVDIIQEFKQALSRGFDSKYLICLVTAGHIGGDQILSDTDQSHTYIIPTDWQDFSWKLEQVVKFFYSVLNDIDQTSKILTSWEDFFLEKWLQSVLL